MGVRRRDRREETELRKALHETHRTMPIARETYNIGGNHNGRSKKAIEQLKEEKQQDHMKFQQGSLKIWMKKT